MRRPAAVLGGVMLAAVALGAVQLTLERRAIEEAIYIGQSRIESERTRFHAPYRVRVAQPPVDWIDVITPFHRVELAAEMNARSGGRLFSQREALDILQKAQNQIDFIIELSFHPLNTFVSVPAYEVSLIVAGNRRVAPQRLDRYPRFGPRAESSGPALPNPNAVAVFGGGEPVLGATIIAAFDGAGFDPSQRIELVMLDDGKKELMRAGIDLGKMR